ncbi:hypothetical protein TeGR_g10273 [Tetraparma gracilis]|uniref:Kinesin light chain n=1 Tax=Tetraparma gracilis TaxID=2962635 RepID=A0ABQ6M5D9_9STRA|nr:hypothetical protein TeGR_g10273 [Tetraparma gracilis]
MGCTSSKGVDAPICSPKKNQLPPGPVGGPETLHMLQYILGMMQARNACREVAKLELLLGLLNDPALKSFGGSPGHPEGAGADLTELHERAGWFRVELEKVIEGFLRSLGIDPQMEIKALDEEGKEKTFKAFTMAGLKTMESCTRKMTDDYDGDHMRICDVVRCSIVVETEKQLAAVLKALVGGQIKGEGVKVTVVRLKNRIVELTGEEETAEAAFALFNKGVGQYMNKEYDAALVSYGKALEIRIKLEGEGGSNVIGTRQNIALVYGDKGEHERALEEYEVVLKLSKASSDPELGEEGKGTATIMSNMGNVHREMEDYDKALELLKRGLEMKEKAGEEKARILTTVGEIANTYDDMGRYSEAVEWHERGLAGREAELGKNHPSTLTSVNNLALACYRGGDTDRAVELLERCEEGGMTDSVPDLKFAYGQGGPRFAAKLEALQQKYPNV